MLRIICSVRWINDLLVNYSVIELPSIRLAQPTAVQLLGASMTPLLLS